MTHRQDGMPLAIRPGVGVLVAGEAIPLGARIIAVCDAYDAMTTTRPYRQAMREADAVAELRRCAGQQFDPVVVAAFERVVGTDRADVAERLAA